jgi:hypothetical protein
MSDVASDEVLMAEADERTAELYADGAGDDSRLVGGLATRLREVLAERDAKDAEIARLRAKLGVRKRELRRLNKAIESWHRVCELSLFRQQRVADEASALRKENERLLLGLVPEGMTIAPEANWKFYRDAAAERDALKAQLVTLTDACDAARLIIAERTAEMGSLRAQIAEVRKEADDANAAVQALNAGKPLGEIAGAQMIGYGGGAGAAQGAARGGAGEGAEVRRARTPRRQVARRSARPAPR